MAGGVFHEGVDKVRPGTYINFGSNKQNVIGLSERGKVLIPLIGHNYGPEGTFITITSAVPDQEFTKLGYSIYDDNPHMLLIREALKRAGTVIVYIPKSGTKAQVTGGGVTAVAAYGGERGNDLSFTVKSNPVGGFDVSVYLAGRIVELYEGLSTGIELSAEACPYISFTGAESLVPAAGQSLIGGTNAETTNVDITAFLDKMEGVSFDTLAFPVTDEALHTACKTKIKYLRENVGKGVKAVVPDFAADYEGIINVTNAVVVSGKTLTNAEACAWVAGADAAASNVQSNTYSPYEGATEIAKPKTHEGANAAIVNGEFFFSYGETGAVVVEYDINSLTSFTGTKDKSYCKNRVLRVIDTFSQQVKINFPPNKFDNNAIGWEVMEGLGRTLLRQFYESGAIKDVDYESDFTVDKSRSNGDAVYFNIALTPVDSAEKLYVTILTR